MEQQEAAPETTAAPGEHQLALSSSFSSLAASTSSHIIAHMPSMEDSVKFSGGAVAALLAMRYAGSLRSACVVGLLSGLFAHSLYADVLRKKRRRGDKRQEKRETGKDTATELNEEEESGH